MSSTALRFPDGPVSQEMPYVMRGIELATSFVTGSDPRERALRPRPVASGELPGALEGVLLRSLQRPPCVVAFSGGRDSAGLLAAAARAARRHGLPLPIPATYRFPGVADVDETAWQDTIVRHLGLKDWLRVDVSDELDIVGPVARPLLRRFGPMWPPNSHFAGLLVPHARGGTFVTGVGGDELLEPVGHRAAQLLSGRARPRRGDARVLAAAVAPRAVRVVRGQRRIAPLPWLTPQAAATYARARAREALEPVWWGKSVTDKWWRSRERLALRASIAAACGEEVAVEHPFMDRDFLSAVAGALWHVGFPTRAAAMDLLFAEALPPAVRRRSDKAAFFAPFINRHSRAFLAGWDGSGLDKALVDVSALRACWSAERVDARSYALLQSAWLATTASVD
jgi:asparagine synthase (glutamine-hydrolysing)